MSDDNRPTGTDEHDSTGWIVLGVVLIVAGFFLGARTLGIMPWPFVEAWGFAVKARYGIGVILAGILLIVWAQSGRGFAAPARGSKLYRSREKWLAGVLGGLADYFSIDATLLRLAFIALVVLFDMGALVIAYIIMAIVVPVEPAASAAAPVVAAPPAPASAPASAPLAPAPEAAAPAPAPETDAPPADDAPAGT